MFLVADRRTSCSQREIVELSLSYYGLTVLVDDRRVGYIVVLIHMHSTMENRGVYKDTQVSEIRQPVDSSRWTTRLSHEPSIRFSKLQ